MLILNQSQTQFEYTLPDGSTNTETRESNIVSTEMLDDNFTKIKTSDRTFLQEGETANQTVTLTNGTMHHISNVMFYDTLTGGGSYVSGSVVVNGTPQPTFDPAVGFNLGDIAIGAYITVNYKVRANNPLTESYLKNFATIKYTVDGRDLSSKTNEVNLVLVSNRLTITKSVDKAVAIVGDILHYTSTIKNTGSLLKSNISFEDNIPTGTSFVENSVLINGADQPGYNPETGFMLPNLNPGESVIVEFDVVVN